MGAHPVRWNVELSAQRYKAGWTLARIAKAEKVSIATVSKRFQKIGLITRNPAEAQLGWAEWEVRQRGLHRMNLSGLSPENVVRALKMLAFTTTSTKVSGTRRISIDEATRDIIVRALEVALNIHKGQES